MRPISPSDVITISRPRRTDRHRTARPGSGPYNCIILAARGAHRQMVARCRAGHGSGRSTRCESCARRATAERASRPPGGNRRGPARSSGDVRIAAVRASRRDHAGPSGGGGWRLHSRPDHGDHSVRGIRRSALRGDPPELHAAGRPVRERGAHSRQRHRHPPVRADAIQSLAPRARPGRGVHALRRRGHRDRRRHGAAPRPRATS